MSIKHGIKIERHNFPLEWVTPEPKQYAPQGPYYPGKLGGGGYQPGLQPLIPPPGGTYQPPPQKKPTQPYNWHPAKWVDERHPKIAAAMATSLTKFCRRCSVSNILTAGSKRFNSLPRLDAYPAGICWLHSIASCPYGTQCSFAPGHVKKVEITDSIAYEVIGALQPGITEIMNKPLISPLGKRKWRGPGQGGGTLNPPQM